jgi:hypothetical protein
VLAALDRLKFEGSNRDVLMNFLHDLVQNAVRTGSGKRYSDSTLDLFSLVAVRSIKAATTLSVNLGGPCETTIRDHIKATRLNLDPGIAGTESAFATLGSYYSDILKELKIEPGSVLVELSEDETVLAGAIEYDTATCCFVGTCGRVGEDHKCDSTPVHFVATGKDAYAKLTEFLLASKVAHCKWKMVCFSLLS